MSITKILKNNKFISLLIYNLVFLVILIANFPIGKFFVGWDALNPEFNFPVNFQRSLFASWQENYGLGTLGGHGFAAVLPHNIVTFILSLFLPVWAIRLTFTFLYLYLGGLGFYFLIRLILQEIGKKQLSVIPSYIGFIALLSGLFYALNLGTIQMFYLQLEAFIVHFAALPWLFWIVLRLLQKLDKKNLLLFLLINFFASAQGFIPILFVTYLVVLYILLYAYSYKDKNSLQSLKKSAVIVLFTILINAYWLLPLGYYQIARGGITLNAYNNLMSTEDFILKNKKYGNLPNIALIKGFSFDMQELGGYVFQPWIDQQNKVSVSLIGYVLFGFIVFNLVASLFYLRNWLAKALAVIFLYFFGSLAIDTLPFSIITNILQFLYPTYQQAFRTTFTKFSLGVAFSYSLFFGIGIFIVLSLVSSRLRRGIIRIIFLLLLFIILIYYSKPVFQGNLLYKKLLVTIPQAYFEVFDFFKDKEDGRIADFPQDCPEGWYGYKWGYFGSGFYWYAIRQPILARSFDVWSNYNENYYWEIVQALRSQDYSRADQILQKYDVKWILFDQNLIHCRTAKGFLGHDEFIKYLEESSQYRLVKTLNSGIVYPIKIFENIKNNNKTFISIYDKLPNIGPQYKWTSNDKTYTEYQTYLSDKRESYDVYYPFRSLFTGRKQEELEFKVEDRGEYFSFQTKIPKDLAGGKLVVPQIYRDEVTQIDEADLSKSYEKNPQVILDSELIEAESGTSFDLALVPLNYIKDGNLEIRVPKIEGYYSYDSGKTGDLFKQQPKSCDQFNKGKITHEKIVEGNDELLRLTSTGSSNCADFDLPNLSQKIGYLVTINGRYGEGKSMLFAVINKNSERADIETYLPKIPNKITKSYFIVPPMEDYGKGYTLHFDNISIGRVKTVNDLGKIAVNPIPYRFLTSLKIVKQQDNQIDKQSRIISEGFEVDHPNPSFYRITVGNQPAYAGRQLTNSNSTLVLSQSYDKGWKAYQITSDWFLDSWYMKLLIPFFQPEIKDHVLVNNWENGWNIQDQISNIKNQKDSVSIVIIYLPQYLEYLGFALLGGLFIYMLILFPKNKRP